MFWLIRDAEFLYVTTQFGLIRFLAADGTIDAYVQFPNEIWSLDVKNPLIIAGCMNAGLRVLDY